MTIYPNATILGGQTVVGAGSTINGSVFLIESVPPGHTVSIRHPQPEIRPRPARRTNKAADSTDLPENLIPPGDFQVCSGSMGCVLCGRPARSGPDWLAYDFLPCLSRMAINFDQPVPLFPLPQCLLLPYGTTPAAHLRTALPTHDC